ncbi:MAG TPA: hypothetical protein VGQ18_07060 [Gemmatimonadales bacterium]|jgi:hypothetical protein|nr:hypothetical protein [Gemmatimonadales bacterium]
MTARYVALLVLAVGPSGRLAAQDTSRVNQPAHFVRPMGAFWRSLLIPGWGQSATGRNTTGAVFVAWEGVTAMMTLKAQQEANYMESIGSANAKAKRQEVQDWLVLWVFNHLFSGAEAYVSAHLQDFPADLKIQAYPRGIGISLPLR